MDDTLDSLTPPGLQRANYVATLLDDAIEVPGTDIRFGLDAVVGLLPVSGDVASAILSLYIVVEAIRSGVPRSTAVRMLFNVVLDAVVGSIPLVGDLFDVYFKANRRNIRLFERAVGADR
jgi:hypothetical protein